MFNCINYLWYSVRRWVHELGEVHHTLPLVLGDMDALDRGESGIGVPEVFQLELPLRQPGPRQLHKHLWISDQHKVSSLEKKWQFKKKKKSETTANVTLCLRRTMSWERRIRPQSLAGWMRENPPVTYTHMSHTQQIYKRKPRPPNGTSSPPVTCTTTGKPLWLMDMLLRVSTMVPTFSILFKHVTGELITSLDRQFQIRMKKIHHI